MSIQTIRVVFVGTFPRSENSSIIDLGMVSASELYRVGVKELIPYSPGRFVRQVFFTFDGFVPVQDPIYFIFQTPNISSNGGIGKVQDTAGPVALDTIGLQILENSRGPNGLNSSGCQILDTTPLFAVAGSLSTSSVVSPWVASTGYSAYDVILDPHDKWRGVLIAGTSGTDISVFDDPGEVTDGTVTWLAAQDLPVGSIHAFAEVIDAPEVTLPIPTTLEWVTQPSNAVAGVDISPTPAIRILDQNGNPYVFGYGVSGNTFGAITLALLTDVSLSQGSYEAQYADPVTGIFSLTGLNISDTGVGYVIRAYWASGVNVQFVDSDPFNIT